MALPQRVHRARTLGGTLQRRFRMRWNRSTPAALPRNSALRIQLSLLGWFLRDELPKRHPELFPEHFSLTPCPDQGWSNLAFIASGYGEQRYMVRMRAETQRVAPENSPYFKESWILKNLGSDVPHAHVFANGIGQVKNHLTDAPYSWFVQSFLPYQGADRNSDKLDPIEFRQKLGGIAHAINQVTCKGYGTCFNNDKGAFHETSWHDALQHEIADAGFEAAVGAGFLSAAGANCLKKRIKSLEQLAFKPALYHVDFAENWSNVLIDSDGNIKGIIDWELAGSGPALHYEFANILYVMMRDGRSKQEMDRLFGAFLSGYGLTLEEYRQQYAHEVETLILLLAVQKLRRYLDLDRQGKLREHRWRVAFFERCGDLVKLGSRLSECEDRRILIAI